MLRISGQRGQLREESQTNQAFAGKMTSPYLCKFKRCNDERL